MTKTRRSTLAASAATIAAPASTAVALTKTIIGAAIAKPATVKLPQAVSEIHVSPDEVIAAGTVITAEIAAEAGLDEDDVLDLIDGGHVKLVEVFAMTDPTPAPAPEA